MPLHHSKKTALLNSLNCISSNDLTSLKDLSDGKCLLNILSTTFNESSDYVEKSDIPISETGKIVQEKSEAEPVDNAVIESGDIALSEDPLDICMLETENVDISKKCSSECVIEQIESPDGIDKVILERFKFIQNFIDRRYNLKSDEIISYSKCIKGNEFELAKVAVFILSEVVSHFVTINNDHLRTLAHLDVRIQEDLEECFHLCISKREEITKKDLEKILNNHAKYKSRSPKTPFATPRRNCASKYRVDSSTSPTNEEIFSNSPLKSFFESPVFKKEDILRKDKELVKTRNILHEEEIKTEDLRLELSEAKKKIDLKEKEIATLKATLKMLESDKNSQDFGDELKNLQEKYDSLKKESDHKYKQYEAEITDLLKQNRFLEFEAKTGQGFSHYLNAEEEDLRNELIHKDMLLGKKNDMVIKYRLKQSASFVDLTKMQSMLATMTDELNAERQKSKDIEIQAEKDREFYSAKLSELKKAIKTEPKSPAIGENLGVIIEEENRVLRLKLDGANLKIKQLEEKMQHMTQPEQNNVPNCKNSFNTSVVEGLDLANTPKHRYSKRGSISTFEALDLKETPKLKNRHSEKYEELNDSLAECDMLNNSKGAFKNSSSSLHSEVPFNNDTTEMPVLKNYGALWKNLENSCMEIDNTDDTSCTSKSSNKPEDCDKICSKCHVPYKNGYNLNSALTQELKKKDEEIAVLKANCETLEQQTTVLNAKCDALEQKTLEYLSHLTENNRTIEDLKLKLYKTEKASKMYYSKYEQYKESFLSHQEKVSKYDMLFSRLKAMEVAVKKSETRYKYEIESLKASRRKKDQEILVLTGMMKQLEHQNKYLEKKNGNLEKKMQSLETKAEETFKKLKVSEQKLLHENKKSKCVKEEENPTDVQEQIVNQRSESFFVGFATEFTRDMNNESTMSGALYRKNGLSLDKFALNGEDEDSFFNHTSLPCPSEQETRTEELIRRNSVLPFHLQSSYPTEMNLKFSADEFYVKNAENVSNLKSETFDTNSQNIKKRKIQEVDSQSVELASTPLSKVRRTFKTPSSLKKLLHFSRSRRNGVIKPKP